MIIGLTGAIGAGKSFVARCFKNLNAAIFDADSIVHQLYREDQDIINYAKKNFPEAVIQGEIDRAILSKYFLAYDANWAEFQSLIHSVIKQKLELFINAEKNRPLSKPIYDQKFLGEVQVSTAEYSNVFEERSSASTTKLPLEIEFRKRSNKKLSILDIPLLFEAKFHLYCSHIIFVSANENVRNQRLNERNIDKKVLDLISNIQLPIEEKKKISDFIIYTDESEEDVFLQVKGIVDSLNLDI
ncbi:MAG: Dephospho-CoA kinase [Wolbachia endosymbiont of Ctenocephalides orientis wCori]|nr:MAG: Dephospho-CoA kinase [Wolbachia endosymbiont of Ctenocephalides orientis wCori]